MICSNDEEDWLRMAHRHIFVVMCMHRMTRTTDVTNYAVDSSGDHQQSTHGPHH